MNKVIFLFYICLFITFSGCSSENNSKNDFNLEDFEGAIKEKGYNIDIQDVKKDFLPTTRKRMLMERAINMHSLTIVCTTY